MNTILDEIGELRQDQSCRILFLVLKLLMRTSLRDISKDPANLKFLTNWMSLIHYPNSVSTLILFSFLVAYCTTTLNYPIKFFQIF